MSEPEPRSVDPNPPAERCPRSGAPVYTRRPPLARLLRRAREAGVPGAADLVIRACPFCAGLHLMVREAPERPPAPPTTTRTCRKRRYRSELHARVALGLIRRDDDTKRQESRAYRCPVCHGAWHLTSRT